MYASTGWLPPPDGERLEGQALAPWSELDPSAHAEGQVEQLGQLWRVALARRKTPPRAAVQQHRSKLAVGCARGNATVVRVLHMLHGAGGGSTARLRAERLLERLERLAGRPRHVLRREVEEAGDRRPRPPVAQRRRPLTGGALRTITPLVVICDSTLRRSGRGEDQGTRRESVKDRGSRQACINATTSGGSRCSAPAERARAAPAHRPASSRRARYGLVRRARPGHCARARRRRRAMVGPSGRVRPPPVAECAPQHARAGFAGASVAARVRIHVILERDRQLALRRKAVYRAEQAQDLRPRSNRCGLPVSGRPERIAPSSVCPPSFLLSVEPADCMRGAIRESIGNC